MVGVSSTLHEQVLVRSPGKGHDAMSMLGDNKGVTTPTETSNSALPSPETYL